MKTFHVYISPDVSPIVVLGGRFHVNDSGELLVVKLESGQQQEFSFTAAAGKWVAIQEVETE